MIGLLIYLFIGTICALITHYILGLKKSRDDSVFTCRMLDILFWPLYFPLCLEIYFEK